MNGRRAPMPTPISCVACGGGEQRAECKLCEGVGLVSRALAGRWERARMARLRITKQFFKIEVATRQFCRMLESRRTDSDEALAIRGRALLAEPEPEAGSPEKTILVDRHLDFHLQCIAKLRGDR